MNQSIEDTAQFIGSRNKERQFDRLLASYHNNLTDEASNSNIETSQILSASFTKLMVQLVAVMAMIAIAILSMSKIYGAMVARGGHATTQDIHQISIGNDALQVPANMIRFRSQRNAHNLNRLDLYAHWPTMSGYNNKLAKVFDDMSPGSPILFISIEPRDMTTDMSGRVNTIYSKFFDGSPVDAGNGLLRRSFSADSAYHMEDLYYEADSPYPFAARCVRKSDHIANSICIRDIHIGKDLMIGYRFHENLLPHWHELDRKVRNLVQSMMMQ